jgi:hypothetical protein
MFNHETKLARDWERELGTTRDILDGIPQSAERTKAEILWENFNNSPDARGKKDPNAFRAEILKALSSGNEFDNPEGISAVRGALGMTDPAEPLDPALAPQEGFFAPTGDPAELSGPGQESLLRDLLTTPLQDRSDVTAVLDKYGVDPAKMADLRSMFTGKESVKLDSAQRRHKDRVGAVTREEKAAGGFLGTPPARRPKKPR